MNQQIINKYNVSFQNKIFDFGTSGKILHKSLDMNNPGFGSFLLSWRDPQEINDLLISDINAVLNGTSSLIENGSETISIDITTEKVIFYIPNVGTNYPTVPPNDFNEIVLAWRDFLLQSPLDGSSV